MHNDYSVEIDLGREESADMPMAASPSSPDKKGKKRKFYPTLYIDAVPGMPALPKEGRLLIEYRRKRMSVEENPDGKETTGMTLEIQKLCLPEDMADDGDEDMESAMTKFAKGEGVDTGRAEPDDDDDEESDEEKD